MENVTLFDDWMHDTYLAPSDAEKVTAVQSDEEFAAFETWARSHDRPIAYDIETSGLHIFGRSWELKTLQWGDDQEAFVFISETPWIQKSVDLMMSLDVTLLAHNASFDALGLHRAGLVGCDDILTRTQDTYILAHLNDPRPRSMGGTGLGLKDLADNWIGKGSSDSGKALLQLFEFSGWKVSEGFAKIPKTHPTLITYGGMDAILTARLYPKIKKSVEERGVSHLVRYEHKLMRLTAEMQLRGVMVDVPYAKTYGDELLDQVRTWTEKAQSFGIENPMSKDSVVDVLSELGADLRGRTRTGGVKLDHKELEKLQASHEGTAVAEICESVLNVRELTKFKAAYVDGVLAFLDENRRVHPSIGSLRAITARMAVESPPLQQIPAKDAAVRRMFIADEGCSMAAVDFAGVELRIMAALSQDPKMVQVFEEDGDLHQETADAVGVSRKVGKAVNFAKTYGAGPRQIAEVAGITQEEALIISDTFNETYKTLNRYDRNLREPIRRYKSDHVKTYTGRKIPVNPEKAYMALNYVVQSTARDVLGKAMVNLKNDGLFEYALLPVHDEVLFSFPEDEAEDLCREAALSMECSIKGVDMVVEATLGNRSWGSLKEEGEHESVSVH